MSSWIVEKATKAFVDCQKVPILSQARFDDGIRDNVGTIKSTWNQTDSISGSRIVFDRHHTVSFTESGDFKVISRSMPSSRSSSESLSAFDSSSKVEVRISKMAAAAAKDGDEVDILEVWNATGLVQSVNLSETGAPHGPVHLDQHFGSLSLDPSSSSRVAFVAEEWRPKSSAFTKGFGASSHRQDDEGQDGEEEEEERKGSEYEYVEDWGEQLVGKSQTVIVTFDLNSRELHVWSRPVVGRRGKEKKGRNLHQVLPPDVCPGQVVWGPDGLLFGVATRTTPRRLGYVYCTNRTAHVFKLDTNNGRYSVVSDDGDKINCRRPKFVRDRLHHQSYLLWFERDLGGGGGVYPGAHQAASKLMKLNLRQESPEVVVDIVEKFDPEKDEFPGFYAASFPADNCVLVSKDDGPWVVVNSCVTHYVVPVASNLRDGRVKVLQELKHSRILDIVQEADRSVVVGARSVPDDVPKLLVGSLQRDGCDFKVDVGPIQDLESDRIVKDLELETVWKSFLTRPPGSPFKLASFYFGPKHSEGEPPKPLLVWIHGGPNSIFLSDFKYEQLFFLKMGYGVLAVNYRGSLGHGADCETSLLGHVGDFDVKDCVQIVARCFEEVPGLDESKIFLFGGSHGGFLVTQLAGQYPDMFKAVVCRNPALDLPSMSMTSDIPDWVVNQGQGSDYSPDAALSNEALKELAKRSSTRHCHKIKTPVFFMIGNEDVRVPPSQGIELYKRLKAMGKPVRMNVYEDNHPLSKVPVHTDVMINTVVFFHNVDQ